MNFNLHLFGLTARALALTFLLVGVSALAIGQNTTWNKIENHTDVTATGTYLIVETNSSNSTTGYALTSQYGSSSAPLVVPVTLDDSGSIIVGEFSDNIKWKFEKQGDINNYKIYPVNNNAEFLYSTGQNNGVRVGTNSNNIWELNVTHSSYPNYKGFSNVSQGGRYFGVFNHQDFRTYSPFNANIQNSKIEIFELEESVEPSLSTDPTSLSDFSYIYQNGPSAYQSFTLTGANLDGTDVEILADNGLTYEISLDGEYYTNELLLTAYYGAETPIYVRLSEGLDEGEYIDFLMITGGGFDDIIQVDLTGNVNPPLPPAFTVSKTALSGFSYNNIDGGPSAHQSFTISADNTTGANVLINNTFDYFEFSTDNIVFYSELTLSMYDGSETEIYVRLIEGLMDIALYDDLLIISGEDLLDEIYIELSGSVSDKSNAENLVISQIYGGGGNNGAIFRNDFVELYNPTNNPINLSGLSVQYASAAGSSWSNKVNLPDDTIDPGKYYLIQLISGGSNGDLLPTPDFSPNSINMAGASGKVALVNSTNNLTGDCPTENIVDFVGYGTANCFEGEEPAPAAAVDKSIIRKLNGRQDTEQNSNDFDAVTPTPRNSASPIHLPVDLLTFTATPREEKVALNWTYANPEAFDKFIVEHSKNGITWDEIASVPLLESNVRSVDASASAIHNNPAKGVNYYRLKMVDIDGTYDYSNIVAVNMSGVEGSIKPVNTIVGQQIHLINTGVEGKMSVRMTDMNGRILLQETHNNMENTHELFIEAGHLPIGMFMMTITTGEEESSYKLIKQ